MTEPNAAETDQGQAPDGYVPITALQAERDKRQQTEVQLAELRGAQAASQQFNSQQQQPPKTEPAKPLTVAQLQTAVDNGEIDQNQMTAYLHKQATDDATEKATATITSNLQKQQRDLTLDGDITRYQRAAPELNDPTSDLRKRVDGEYAYLTGIGQPQDKSTALAAMRNALGPVDALEHTQERSDTSHIETGGGRQDNPGGDNQDGSPKGMSKPDREYYEKHMGPGKLYADWKAVAEERKVYVARSSSRKARQAA